MQAARTCLFLLGPFNSCFSSSVSEGPFLSEKGIEEFLNDLDKNNNGYIENDEVQHIRHDVHKAIAPNPKPHHLHHEDREDAARHQFLKKFLGTNKNYVL